MRLVLHNHFTPAAKVVTARFAPTPKMLSARLQTQDYLQSGHAVAGRTTHDCAGDEEPCGCGYYKTVDSTVDDYLTRVDSWLSGLPDVQAKRKFLQKQRVEFERRYTDYRKRAGSGGRIGPNESANAYIETLSGLTTRLNRLG